MPPLAAAPIASFPARRRARPERSRCRAAAGGRLAKRPLGPWCSVRRRRSTGPRGRVLAQGADPVGGDLGSAGGGPVRHDGVVTNATGSSVPRPPTGEQVRIRHGGHEAVTVAVAAGLRTCSLGGSPVLDGFAEDERPGGGRGQTLIPWPNRVADGRYRFDAVDQQLPLTEPAKGNAIHGL